MPVTLTEPDDIIKDNRGGETPAWKCPHCERLLKIDDFGWRKRDDIYPGQHVWHKQSWCKDCRGS